MVCIVLMSDFTHFNMANSMSILVVFILGGSK